MVNADLFADETPLAPAGFDYRAEAVSPKEEAELLERLAALPFSPFEFHGFKGKRQVVSFGQKYDFNLGRPLPADPLPTWLATLGDHLAAWARWPPASIGQALVTRYDIGAPIGWHRDRPVYEDVIGLSLLSACELRFRRRLGAVWDRRAVLLEPRSAYLLSGEARWAWQHSIAPATQVRYSVTFRRLRGA